MRQFGLIAVAVLITAVTCWAQPKQNPGPRPRALERLSRMTPEQRERAMQRLPEERRHRLQQRLDEYNRMNPEERDRLQRQFEAFRQLPPERQQAVRGAFRRFNNLPDRRKSILRDELRSLQRMSPEERRNRLNSDDFRNRYRPFEQRVLENLADVPVPDQP